MAVNIDSTGRITTFENNFDTLIQSVYCKLSSLKYSCALKFTSSLNAADIGVFFSGNHLVKHGEFAEVTPASNNFQFSRRN